MVTLYFKKVIFSLFIFGVGTVIYANDIDGKKYKEVTIQEIKNAGVNNVGPSTILLADKIEIAENNNKLKAK
jgi:hypothetical protein